MRTNPAGVVDMVMRTYARCRDELSGATHLQLATLLTTLLVAFHGFKAWYVRLPAQGLVVFGLVIIG